MFAKNWLIFKFWQGYRLEVDRSKYDHFFMTTLYTVFWKLRTRHSTKGHSRTPLGFVNALRCAEHGSRLTLHPQTLGWDLPCTSLRNLSPHPWQVRCPVTCCGFFSFLCIKRFHSIHFFWKLYPSAIKIKLIALPHNPHCSVSCEII